MQPAALGCKSPAWPGDCDCCKRQTALLRGTKAPGRLCPESWHRTARRRVRHCRGRPTAASWRDDLPRIVDNIPRRVWGGSGSLLDYGGRELVDLWRFVTAQVSLPCMQEA